MKKIKRIKPFYTTDKFRIFPLPTIVIAKPVKDLAWLYTERQESFYGIEISIRFLRFAVGFSIAIDE